MSINWKLVFLMALATVANCGKAQSKFEEGLLKVLEKSKRGDVASLPIAVPSLKSFKLNPMKIKYDGFTTDLSELTVRGLENLKVEKFSASETDLTVSLAFSVPALDVRADKYHLQGRAFIININDRGAFRADVRNLKAKAVVKFGAAGANTVIQQINIDYSLAQVQAYLSGSSGIVSSGFNGKLTKLLTTDKNIVITKAKQVIEKSVNEILKGLTPAKLIEIISKM